MWLRYVDDTLVIQKYSVINTLTQRDKQFVINLSFSRKKWITSGRHSLSVGNPNGSETRWKEGLLSQKGRKAMKLTTRALLALSQPLMK